MENKWELTLKVGPTTNTPQHKLAHLDECNTYYAQLSEPGINLR